MEIFVEILSKEIKRRKNDLLRKEVDLVSTYISLEHKTEILRPFVGFL